ncbi:MAG: hypothetical protein COA67_05845 [Lutibacter sp.]|nr:MAG: hypothetical protein COA67_05845 [Lutibacter sp.]
MKKIIFLLVITILLASCKKEHKSTIINKEKSNKNYAKIGKEYTLATKTILGKNLKQAIAKEGLVGAMSFCNEQAYSLTDSMQVKYNAIIKRVSDKNRNQNNKANAIELSYINTFKEKLKNGEKIKPIIEKSDGKIHFYSPIKTNQLCLQCHGKQLQPNLIAKLKDLYPNDLAVGYDDNQVRGIWSITFDE